MPFTPSHAVVALPFVRTRLVPAAIAVGAMTPDLPLFVRGTPITYGGTHDPRALAATVLLALVLLLVWRCVLRPAVRELSPGPVGERLPAEWDRGPAAVWHETFPRQVERVLWLVVSLLIGVVTHILWDAFTHEGRFGSTLVPALDEKWGPLAGYTWLQHGSSVVGLGVLGVYAVLWMRRRTPHPVDHVMPAAVRWAWWASLPVLLAAAWLIGLSLWGPLTAEFTPAHLGYRVLPPACALWAALTLALSVAVQSRRSALRSARP
ncbi:DUF4184 family protein [Microbacterium caowuchunii]|uniref:DUF4184 family protein n=1 Tax=Microbacterium caowuchunii TaxID=2614638 RepID=A0A5N0T545_9MICO|nr:DUF4184 family protein [Microbacterium caowuchunii]KAA9129898.1 DUF4184 family protein [Microbacterium caowuchunii]